MPKQPISVLVVDDEPDICANLADIFGELGYHVDVAYDGFSALELLRQRPYDVALLDLRMPGMTGLELHNRIREMQVGTVAVIVTAFASDATAQAALQGGAWRVVPKPVDPQALVQLIVEVKDRPLVMVIDDDPDLCNSLLDVFQEQKFRACVAHTVAEADRRMRGADLDVALIDMRLPEGDGRHVLELIRETNPEARTIVITGYREEMQQLIQQMLAAGVDAICYKPFEVATLLDTIKKLAK